MQSPYVSPMSRKRISSFAPDLAKRERKTTSPLTDLPLELLQCILGYLSFHEMRTVRRVCAKLRELSTSLPVDMLSQKSATLDRLVHVASIHNGVYRLCIRHDTFGVASIPHLHRLTRLTTVLVDSSGPSKDSTASLRNLSALPALTDLTLLHCTPPEELAHLALLTSLKRLSLWLTQSPYDVSFLSTMHSLVCLKLHLTVLPADVTIRVASLSSLRKLHLWTRSAPPAPIQLAALRGLTMLKLDAPLDGPALRALKQVRNLRKLDVFAEKHSLTDADFDYITEFQQLQSLRFASCANLTTAAVEHIARLSLLTSLVLLDCRRMGPGALARFSRLRSLARLWLSNMDVRGADVAALHFPLVRHGFFVNVAGAAAILPSMPCIQQLSLMGERDLSPAAPLPARMALHLARSLTRIHFRYLPITDADVEDLEPLSRLESLHIEGCWRLTAAMLAPLARVASLSRLSLWNLEQLHSSPLLGDLTQLRSLRIGLCEISVAALAYFTSLSRLRRLDLNLIEGPYHSSAAAAADQLEQLRKALPSCDVHYEPWPL